MCGIVGLHLRAPSLYPRLGELMTAMLGQLGERGPDAAGLAVYGDPRWSPAGTVSVTALAEHDVDASAVSAALGAPVETDRVGQCVLFRADASVSADALAAAVRSALPELVVIGLGDTVTVLKGVGAPGGLAEEFGLAGAHGYQGVAHTRMATESAVTPAHSHPFSVGADQCLVHNGSFSNHATIRRELRAEGVTFDSDNDTEVGARFVAARLAEGHDLEKALRLLTERFDGFYTLLVANADSFAVVRDPIACKPAVIAESEDWVAVASEYRALAALPGVERARLYEPEPDEVYVWRR